MKIGAYHSAPINELKIIVHRTTLLFIVFLFSTCLLAQDYSLEKVTIDNLLELSQKQSASFRYDSVLKNATSALNKSNTINYRDGVINSLLILANAYRLQSKFTISLNQYLQAQAEIDKDKDPGMLYKVNYALGELYMDWGVPEKALIHYNKAKSYQSSISQTTSHKELLTRIATVQLKLGNQKEALANYNDLLILQKQQKDIPQTINTLKRIASVHNQLNQYKNALNTNFEILELNKSQKDSLNMAVTYNAIGFLYKDLDDLPKALEYFNLALEVNQLIGHHGTNNNNIVSNLINKAVILQSMGDYRNSIKSFNDALKIKEKSNSPVETAVMHNYLASIYFSLSNYNDAKKHTTTSIGLLKGTENKRMLSANYKRLTDIHKRLGDYKSALESYEQYSIIKDSLLFREQLTQERENYKQFVIENTEKVSKLNIIDQEMRTLELTKQKVETEKEKQEIELLLREKELQNVNLVNDQLEQDKQLNQLLLQQRQIESQKKDQEIVLLEQTQELQNIELQKNELLRKERQKEIELQNSKLELQQAQLERSKIRQNYLIWTSGLFMLIIVLIVYGYFMKRRDNKILQSQYSEINKQKEQIEGINKELIVLNEEKNDLISIVAHDLKSPLNQISGILDLIKLTAKDQSDEQQEYIAKIDQSAQRLKRMVTKILDVSAIESKTLNVQLETVSLDEILKETVNQFIEMANKKDITIVEHYDDNLKPVKVDAGFATEVFENLVSNSIKYSPIGEKVDINLFGNGEFVRVEFIDRGQGISEDDMKKLFGKYHKLSARPTAGEDSTGLGLSIVKKYVEAMNGKVWCESEEGNGASFKVEFATTS